MDFTIERSLFLVIICLIGCLDVNIYCLRKNCCSLLLINPISYYFSHDQFSIRIIKPILINVKINTNS